MSGKPLSDTLVVATKDRPDDVAGLLELLGGLTELPDRIVVLDASVDDRTADVCRAAPAGLAVEHVRARKAGLASQRNQALELVTSDVVHFLDDDSRPEPDYFRVIMDFFAAEENRGVAGVTGMVTNPGPARRTTPYHRLFLLDPPQGGINRAGRNAIMRTASGPVEVTCVSGCTMSFRTGPLLASRFDEVLEAGPTGGYALGEDLDAGLRVAGRLVCVPEARLRHEESPVNRARLVTYEHASAAFRRRLAEDPDVPVTLPALFWSGLGDAALLSVKRLLGRDPDGFRRASALLRGMTDRSVVRRSRD